MAKFSEYAQNITDVSDKHNKLVEHLNKELSSTATITIAIPPIAPFTVAGSITFVNGILTEYVEPS